jgi:methylsterol monooxygenase
MKYYSIVNIILILFLEIYICNPLYYIVNKKTDIQLIINAIICFIISDLLAYILHYIYHKSKILYKYIHSIHHQEKNPTFLSTIYMHPIEICSFFIIYRLPLIIGVSFNLYTFVLYQTILIIITFLDHSVNKYMFSDHFQHHKYLIGNYATCFQFWDSFFGTKLKNIYYEI